ncbi:MAG: ABC transporter ATP-binding protein, partial [Bacillota bacterium]
GIGEPENVLNTYPYALSGGMSQRVMIAMAVSSNPAILIADEPTTALDVTIERQIVDLIREVRKQFQTSLIWISHDLGVVRQVCERVAVMYAGTVVETGSTESILDNALHPYTQALIKAIPSGRSRGRQLEEIRGMVPGLLSIPEGCIFAPRCDEAQEVCRTGAPPPLVEVEPGRQVACRMRGGRDS